VNHRQAKRLELEPRLGERMESRHMKNLPDIKTSGQKSSLKIFLWDTKTSVFSNYPGQTRITGTSPVFLSYSGQTNIVTCPQNVYFKIII